MNINEIREKIMKLEGFVSIRNSPKRFLEKDPYFAQRAIDLLEKIRIISGEEYAFVHIKEGPYFYCAPFPIFANYNPNVTTVLGVYDQRYFEEYLRSNQNFL